MIANVKVNTTYSQLEVKIERLVEPSLKKLEGQSNKNVIKGFVQMSQLKHKCQMAVAVFGIDYPFLKLVEPVIIKFYLPTIGIAICFSCD